MAQTGRIGMLRFCSYLVTLSEERELEVICALSSKELVSHASLLLDYINTKQIELSHQKHRKGGVNMHKVGLG